MKFMKKATMLVLALGMVLSVSACGGGGQSEAQKEKNFINAIGGTSETYTGTVSERSYTTPQAAATAYVEDEIVGTKEASIVSTESKATYENEDIATLNLPQDIADGAVSVEEMEVAYTETDTAATYSLARASEQKRITVYVIKYETNWKYYSPLPVTGDTVSKSYYESVFDYTKYENCTYSTALNLNMNLTASADGYSIAITMGVNMSQVVKYSEDKIYIEMTGSYTYSIDGQTETESETMAAYLEDNGDELVCYVKSSEMSNQWEEGYLYQIGFDTLEELTPFYDQYLDYTYFTKTDYGFILDEENADKYIEQTLAQDDSFGEMSEMLDFGMDMNLFVKYYVSNGVLSGMREEATLKVNLYEDGVYASGNATIVGEVSCKNYGTTTVVKPF